MAVLNYQTQTTTSKHFSLKNLQELHSTVFDIIRLSSFMFVDVSTRIVLMVVCTCLDSAGLRRGNSDGGVQQKE